MARPVTIFTGQWADMSLEEICKTASEMGYEGLEIATWGQINCHEAATNPAYVEEVSFEMHGSWRASRGAVRG